MCELCKGIGGVILSADTVNLCCATPTCTTTWYDDDDDDDSDRINYIFLGDLKSLHNTFSTRDPIKRSGFKQATQYEHLEKSSFYRTSFIPSYILYILSSNWLCLSCLRRGMLITVVYPPSVELRILSHGCISIGIITKKALGRF